MALVSVCLLYIVIFLSLGTDSFCIYMASNYSMWVNQMLLGRFVGVGVHFIV